jgi:hypothetical protein
MKLTSIQIENFIGAKNVHVALAPVTMFVGFNGAGKSSVRDAVALALTGDMSRVKLKKEAGQLVNDGGKAAFAQVTMGEAAAQFTISGAGKIAASGSMSLDDYPALPLVLSGQSFASLSDTDRRAFLFGLMGIKMGHQDIVRRLTLKLYGGAPDADQAARLDRVKPLLRAGFDAASKDAKAKTTEAKGRWHQITGETYGALKAETWRAETPASVPTAVQLEDAEKAVRTINAAIGEAHKNMGAAEAAAAAYYGEASKLPELEATAARLQRATDKLTFDTLSRDAADAALTAAQAVASGAAAPRVGLVHELAESLFDVMMNSTCGNVSVIEKAQTALESYSKAHGPLQQAAGDPAEAAAARDKLPELTAAADLMRRAFANATRDLKACTDAAAEVTRIKALPVPDKGAVAALRHNVDALVNTRGVAQGNADKLRDAIQAAQQAAGKTAEATAAHAEVQAWGAIGDALAPDGIPAELLAEALGPVNSRLEQSAIDTEWPRAVIHEDMRITGNGRTYALLSESEQWRVDAMLAEAIAHQSGLKLLVLDRVDVLDAAARVQLVAWLDVLACNGELDTGLLFATMKTMPDMLPSSIEAHWVNAGVCAAVELAEAA